MRVGPAIGLGVGVYERGQPQDGVTWWACTAVMPGPTMTSHSARI